MNEITLGNYLRQLRKEKNITTRELGTAIGLSYSYVASIETEKRNPRKDVIEKYIYHLANNSDELKEIKKNIASITGGEFYQEYLDDNNSENQLENLDNDTNTLLINENRSISKKIFDFPINDIFFHLNDKYNSKYFSEIKLSDSERKYIVKLICTTLSNSLENDLSRINQSLKYKYDNLSLVEKDLQNSKYTKKDSQLSPEVNTLKKYRSKLKMEIEELTYSKIVNENKLSKLYKIFLNDLS